MSIKKTDWFPGDVKPVRVGVYERDYGGAPFRTVYCKWDGERWMRGDHSIRAAHEGRHQSLFQDDPWRGLAADPNGDKA